MKPKFQERGQALILIVFAAVVLFGFAALAIDGSRVFSDRRHAQNAADTAVLAAALAKIRTLPPADADLAAHDAGLLRAASNGFDNNGTTNIVEVRSCAGATDPSCAGLPGGANEAEYIQVVIRLVTRTTFARVIGRPEVPSVVTAVARASGSTGSGSANTNAALFATQGGNVDQCFDMNGGGGNGNGLGGLRLNTWGSGIYVNCSSTQAVTLGGSATLQMETNGQVVGCFATNGSFQHSMIDCTVNGGVSQNINASTFAGVPTKQDPPACPPPGTGWGNSYTPGTYSTITVTSGVATMAPGVYCVGSINIVGGGSLTGPSGSVQIVLTSGGITVTGGSSMNFADLEIYSANGNVTIAGAGNSGGILHADRLRYFSTGTGTIDLGGGAELTSPNAYFYFQSGNIVWNGNSILTLHGPPQGDPYGGLLIHKPWDNHQEVLLNGGANIDLTGTFMVPGSPVRINGDANFDLHSQIVGSTFKVAGTSTVNIFYDPSENYSPPNSPMIQLTQ